LIFLHLPFLVCKAHEIFGVFGTVGLVWGFSIQRLDFFNHLQDPSFLHVSHSSWEHFLIGLFSAGKTHTLHFSFLHMQPLGHFFFLKKLNAQKLPNRFDGFFVG